MSAELFAFLEADLAGSPPRSASAPVAQDAVPLLARAAQLVTADWPEADAAAELASTSRCDDLRDAHVLLLRALLRSPFLERKGIRIGRLLWQALELHEAGDRHRPDVASA